MRRCSLLARNKQVQLQGKWREAIPVEVIIIAKRQHLVKSWLGGGGEFAQMIPKHSDFCARKFRSQLKHLNYIQQGQYNPVGHIKVLCSSIGLLEGFGASTLSSQNHRFLEK